MADVERPVHDDLEFETGAAAKLQQANATPGTVGKLDEPDAGHLRELADVSQQPRAIEGLTVDLHQQET